ncbi:SSI family serine proteinase inhibitor [Kineococcus sp. LSe6-4]|uniref:SSI family serine proteinase inhibitor n=1 Tax=Kineococcus halophytocola TaxID=3234027 RepID=A0ABV4GVK5_9ACTN
MTVRRTVQRSARARTVALVVAGFGLLAACGDQQAGAPVTSSSPTSGGSSSSAPSDGVPAASAGDLTVVVDDGAGEQRTWTLTCSADGTTGGDHPDAQNACAAVDAAKAPWAPVPKDMACTQIYGGPQTAVVTGTWRGEPVDARFARNDGCQIARWDRLAPLLQPGTAVSERSRGGA